MFTSNCSYRGHELVCSISLQYLSCLMFCDIISQSIRVLMNFMSYLVNYLINTVQISYFPYLYRHFDCETAKKKSQLDIYIYIYTCESLITGLFILWYVPVNECSGQVHMSNYSWYMVYSLTEIWFRFSKHCVVEYWENTTSCCL